MADISKIRDSFDPEMLQAIGLLFVTAASCEQALALQMARLLCHPNEVRLSTAAALNRTELAVRMRQIQTITYLIAPSPYKEPIATACDDIKDAFSRRNEFAHYANASTEKPNQIKLTTIKYTAKGGVEKPKTYTTKQIVSFTEKIYKLTRHLGVLLDDAGFRRLSVSTGSAQVT